MLVRIRCYGDCVFPIRGVDATLLSLEAALTDHPSEVIWGVFCGPNEFLVGMVVKVVQEGSEEAKRSVLDILVGEDIIRVDERLMNDYPYCTPPGSWVIVQLQKPEEID